MIVGIAGVAGSGKSTAAEVFLERGFVRGKFANGLKEMLRALLRYRGVGEIEIEDMIEGKKKELPHASLGGRTPRHAMQTLGTDWGRNMIHPNYWVDTELKAMAGNDNLLFDDLRFANEERAIFEEGGYIIHIVGRGGIEGSHIGECFVPSNPVMTIVNDGTIEEFRHKVDQLVVDMSWAMAA